MAATYTHLSPSSPKLPELVSHDPLDTAFEDLAQALFNTDNGPSKRSVSDVLKSLTSSQPSTQSYELVEEDDYEQSQITPRLPKNMSAASENDDYTPIRTASISRHLPLNHPRPDLQSLQGAYVKNVERLEDHAERISLAESMEEELHKMKQEIKRSESMRCPSDSSQMRPRQISLTSMSNSIIAVNANARAGGFSSNDFVTSPIGSMRSQKRTASQKMSRSHFSMLEPQQEGRPLDSTMTTSPPTHAVQQPQSSYAKSPRASSQYDRPTTSDSRASDDTYRKAQNLFTDFDGVHIPAVGGYDRASRRISLNQPPLARDSKAYSEAQPGERMVYYPAPVPVMLNLPQRLSKMNWTDREKRRLQALSGIPDEMKKEAAWLKEDGGEQQSQSQPQPQPQPHPQARPRPLSSLPPQLRASAFFDQPSQIAEVQLKDGSAVLTLDSILDAAAHAPVSAFTDHPIVGHLGQEFYGPTVKEKPRPEVKKRASTLSNLLKRQSSIPTLMSGGGRRLSQTLEDETEMADDDPERTADRDMEPDEDELSGPDHDEDDDGDVEGEEGNLDEQHQLGFLGAPTTLLAELQMRKAQQKLRNRTAANAFPNGMHSTLLELDAVAQLQQKARKTKHVALAWEDQEAVEKENNDDEDVPLGVLFPEKNKQTYINQHRPLGLMERKELEENEPLSARRARLRGEVYQPVQRSDLQQSSEAIPTLSVPALDDEVDEQEEETLAQRRKRIQEQQERKEHDLADNIASELGIEAEKIGGSRAQTPEAEETLGQRRKRLQLEREAAVRAGGTLKPQTSMGDLLRANPIGPREDTAQLSASKVNLLMSQGDNLPLVDHIQAAQPNTKPLLAAGPPPYFPNQPLLGHGMQAGLQHTQSAPRVPQLPQYQPMPIMPFGSTPNLPTLSQFGMYNPQLNQSMNFAGMNNMYNNPMTMSGMMEMPQMAMPTLQMTAGMGFNASNYDAIGMGPPLDARQRATINQWRQNIT